MRGRRPARASARPSALAWARASAPGRRRRRRRGQRRRGLGDRRGCRRGRRLMHRSGLGDRRGAGSGARRPGDARRSLSPRWRRAETARRDRTDRDLRGGGARGDEEAVASVGEGGEVAGDRFNPRSNRATRRSITVIRVTRSAWRMTRTTNASAKRPEAIDAGQRERAALREDDGDGRGGEEGERRAGTRLWWSGARARAASPGARREALRVVNRSGFFGRDDARS